MIYVIYRNDPSEIKYELKDGMKAIQNRNIMSAIYGDTYLYPDILRDAKANGYDTVGIYQARRHLSHKDTDAILTEDSITDKDSVYHSWYWIGGLNDFGTNLGLWVNSHPQYRNLLFEACDIVCRKFPEYRQTVSNMQWSNLLFVHNMFIMPTHDFELYVNWLQTIFAELNLPMDASDKPASLLAERLFTIYVMHNYPEKYQKYVSATCYDKETGEIKPCYNGVAD